MPKRICITLLLGLIFVIGIRAQTETCDLEFKFFEYGPESEKNSISDLEISVSGRTKQKFADVPAVFSIQNRRNGAYKVEIKKEGFEKRIKKFDLDCQFANRENNFPVQIYLKRKDVAIIEAATVTKSETLAPLNETGLENDNSSDCFEAVTVKILIDEDGNVVSAEALEGKPALIEKTLRAVRLAKFRPTILGGVPVQVTGNIVYKYKN